MSEKIIRYAIAIDRDSWIGNGYGDRQRTSLAKALLYKSFSSAKARLRAERKNGGASELSRSTRLKSSLLQQVRSNRRRMAMHEISRAIAQAGRVLGLSSEQVERALSAVREMQAHGRVSPSALRQHLAEALPGAFLAAANSMGMTLSEFSRQLEAGQVLAEDLIPKLAAELTRLYGAAAIDRKERGNDGGE